MAALNNDLSAILATIRCQGDYYAFGTSDCAMPNLEVNGVGRISLPLLPIQAEQLIAVATRSPFGRGEETLIDTAIRRTWQIPAENVRITGRNWRATLDTIIARAATGLGVMEPVSAELYKMLVYDAGSFFVEHRDTEKSSGMFATLVLVLPSECSGGELIVRHKGREVSIDLNSADPTEASYAAFYADCVHEVRPVTSGYRLTLIYNLVREAGGMAPTLPDHEAQSRRITALLRNWVDGKLSIADDSPEKLVFPLEHAYTSAELAFSALKNADAAAAAVLISAAPAADCELHLALLAIEESGSAEHSGYVPRGRGRWYRDDDEDHEHADDFEILEVLDSSLTISDWRRADGAHAAIDVLPFLDEELCPLDIFADIEPDEQYFHEATGNEGASFERTYRRAALVLWPQARLLEVLDQAGLTVTLPYLADLAMRSTRGGEGKQSIHWCDAHALSALMLARWAASHRYGGQALAHNTQSFLSSLMQLDDIVRIEHFLLAAPAAGIYYGAENDALVRAANLLAPDRAAEIIEQVVAKNAHMKPAACANLLARLANDAQCTTTRFLLQVPASVLVDTLLGVNTMVTPPEPWQRPASIGPELVADLLTALASLGAATLAERAVTHILTSQKTYDMDTIIIPAMLTLSEHGHSSDSLAICRMRASALAHLHARISEPLAAPHDFARPCVIACHCKHCVELGRFLVDANIAQWIFKAAEQQRRHVEATIRQSGCDLDTALSMVGRPYGLIATKNQSSYERRVAQRKKDLAIRERLHLAEEEASRDVPNVNPNPDEQAQQKATSRWLFTFDSSQYDELKSE